MKKVLLIIDSSQILMDITRKILERAGYSVHCAVGVAGAHEQLFDFSPDGIILEKNLPDGQGLDLCQELRKKSNVPIIFISESKDDELPALKAGATDFLKKPFDYEVLKARISMMLNMKVDTAEDAGGNTMNGTGIVDGEYKGTERRKQIVQPESAVVPVKANKNKFVYMIIAACFAFVFIGGGVLIGSGLLNPRNDGIDYIDISENLVPLGVLLLSDENAKPFTVDLVNTAEGPGYLVPSYDRIEILADSSNLWIQLPNPAGNPCSFIFEITLVGTEETLFQSNLVEPGMAIENLKLKKTLEKGEYTASLIIQAYELGSLNEMTGAQVELKFIVA